MRNTHCVFMCLDLYYLKTHLVAFFFRIFIFMRFHIFTLFVHVKTSKKCLHAAFYVHFFKSNWRKKNVEFSHSNRKFNSIWIKLSETSEKRKVTANRYCSNWREETTQCVARFISFAHQINNTVLLSSPKVILSTCSFNEIHSVCFTFELSPRQ